jgi:hypothetical protein
LETSETDIRPAYREAWISFKAGDLFLQTIVQMQDDHEKSFQDPGFSRKQAGPEESFFLNLNVFTVLLPPFFLSLIFLIDEPIFISKAISDAFNHCVLDTCTARIQLMIRLLADISMKPR